MESVRRALDSNIIFIPFYVGANFISWICATLAALNSASVWRRRGFAGRAWFFCRLCDLWREGVGDSDRRCGGVLPRAVDSLDGRFFVWLGVGVLAVRVVCDELVVGVGSFFAPAYVVRDWGGLGRRGIGEFGVA